MPRNDKSKYSFLVAFCTQYENARRLFYSTDPVERAALPDEVAGCVHLLHDVWYEVAEQAATDICESLTDADDDDDASDGDAIVDAMQEPGYAPAGVPPHQPGLPGLGGALGSQPSTDSGAADVLGGAPRLTRRRGFGG